MKNLLLGILKKFRKEKIRFLEGHLLIDCRCELDNTFKSGSHYKEDENGSTQWKGALNSLHTFKQPNWNLYGRLERRKDPLIIVCNNCGREFSFTLESYERLMEKSYN